jgi:sensor histidine kinase YesM
MENTRKRLHDQCNADVIITSVVGEGTTARIVIPKNDSGQKDESSPKGA